MYMKMRDFLVAMTTDIGEQTIARLHQSRFACNVANRTDEPALLDAANFIRVLEERQGLKIGCPEEIAYRQGFIDAARLRELAKQLIKSGYGQYLLQLLNDSRP